ncbi:Mu transposase domain-containing protein [Aurantimonas aggregata]|uniref:Mu transposase domain-containing protein n=1 Tax=Aurantimonas aggregata TaxID=2047720 RepID=UPI003CCD7DAA
MISRSQASRTNRLRTTSRLTGTRPFTTARDLMRRVGADCAVAIDGNAYSVPLRLIASNSASPLAIRSCVLTMAAGRWRCTAN